MRRYRLAHLTADEIRALRAQAEGQRLQARWAGQGDTAARCADFEYRQKNQVDCAAVRLEASEERTAPTSADTPVEAIFDELLLGRCLQAQDRRQAREWHCLPPE